jgi:hypothetical protein
MSASAVILAKEVGVDARNRVEKLSEDQNLRKWEYWSGND